MCRAFPTLVENANKKIKEAVNKRMVNIDTLYGMRELLIPSRLYFNLRFDAFTEVDYSGVYAECAEWFI